MAATEEIRGVGHSVKRFEDARFIRGKGNYFDDITLPGMLHLEFLRSPFAHARIKSIDTSRAAAVEGVVAVVTGELHGAAQPGLDADALGRHAGRARHRQGALPGPGGRGGDRRVGLHRQGRLRADRRRLRAARGDHEPAAGARGGRGRDPRREGRPDGQPHLRLGGRRQGGDRPAFAEADKVVELDTFYPALPPGAARVLRLRRGRQPGDGQGDDLHDLAGPARPPDALRARRGPARAQDPDHLARPGRRLREQGADLPRLRRRHGGVAPDRPAREVGRGPHRQPHLDRLRPRLPHARRAGAQGREDHRPAREDALRQRRLLLGRPADDLQGRALPHRHRLLRHPRRPRRDRRARTRTRRPGASPTAARSASPRPRT